LGSVSEAFLYRVASVRLGAHERGADGRRRLSPVEGNGERARELLLGMASCSYRRWGRLHLTAAGREHAGAQRAGGERLHRLSLTDGRDDRDAAFHAAMQLRAGAHVAGLAALLADSCGARRCWRGHQQGAPGRGRRQCGSTTKPGSAHLLQAFSGRSSSPLARRWREQGARDRRQLWRGGGAGGRRHHRNHRGVAAVAHRRRWMVDRFAVPQVMCAAHALRFVCAVADCCAVPRAGHGGAGGSHW